MPQLSIHDCMAALERRIQGDLRTDAYDRMLYSTDASIYQVQPHGVLIPRSREDVHAAVETAAAFGVPVLARAAGSSLAGQAVGEALIIDFTKHLDAILEVDVDARTARVEPGVVLASLNRHLAGVGLQFGPDPASAERAAMGGIVSNNSTGSHSILYGMTADHVREMNVILSDGSRAWLGPGNGRPSTGLHADIVRGLRMMMDDEHTRQVIARDTPRHWRRCGGYKPGPDGSRTGELPPRPPVRGDEPGTARLWRRRHTCGHRRRHRIACPGPRPHGPRHCPFLTISPGHSVLSRRSWKRIPLR